MTRCAHLGYATFAAVCLFMTPAIPAREWTHQGQRIQANLESLRADKVVLRQGAARLEIAFNELSAADRQFVEPLRRPRVWTNRAGREISATLLGRDEERVIVQKDDRELRIAIDQLCDQDRLFVSQVFGYANPSESPANPSAANSSAASAANSADASLPPDLRGERVWRRWNGPSIRGSLLKVRDEMAWFTVGNSTVPVPLAQLKPEERAAISVWQSALASQLAAAEAVRAEARAQREAIELAARQAAEEQERLARQKAAMERAEAERIAAAERAVREAEEQAARAAAPSPAPDYAAPASPAYAPPASNATPVASTNSPMPGYPPMPGYTPMPSYSPAPVSTPMPNYASSPGYSPPGYSPPGYSSPGSSMPAGPTPNYSSTDTSMAYSPPSTYSSNSMTSSTASYGTSDDSSSEGSIRLRPRFFKGVVGIIVLVCSFFAFLYRKLSGGEEQQQY